MQSNLASLQSLPPQAVIAPLSASVFAASTLQLARVPVFKPAFAAFLFASFSPAPPPSPQLGAVVARVAPMAIAP